MNGAHKQSIEEQEKAKFSFSGATLLRYQRRNRIWYLPPPSKNLFWPRTSFSSCHVRGCYSRHATISLSG